MLHNPMDSICCGYQLINPCLFLTSWLVLSACTVSVANTKRCGHVVVVASQSNLSQIRCFEFDLSFQKPRVVL